MKFDLECKKHPKYKTKRYPTSCDACLVLYWLQRDGYRDMTDGGTLQVGNKPAKNHNTPGTLN